MIKDIKNMSREELWQLFPITLSKPRKQWAQWYEEEVHVLKNHLPYVDRLRIHHIGSTAIPSIWAKPIIDILVEIDKKQCMQDVKLDIIACGYICMSESENRVSFNKGYTNTGFAEKVFHLHLRYRGDHDELYFRDYLQEHEDCAKEYEQMKVQAWRKFEFNRDAYTESKSTFVLEKTALGKQAYVHRYE